MNIKEVFGTLNIDITKLTDKKQQTDYKIKYVSEYIKRWAIISAERSDISEITFIDCMCNAGVYKDGDCCTAIEVLNIFIEAAMKHKDKIFNLYLNDYNLDSIAIAKKIINYFRKETINNLKIFANNEDVNAYLKKIRNAENIFGYGKAVVLYIDPYDFGTVKIPLVREILEKYYCEVIFNFFISDYVRNIKKDKLRIRTCIGNENVETKDGIIAYMKKQFKVGWIKHFFSYQFKTRTNVELYQIIFVTPSRVGLEKLKEVLWKVFDGKEFHRNFAETGQMSLFSVDDEIKLRVNSYAREAQEVLMEFLKNKTDVTYIDIEVFLIENTMLASGQIINYVLKPLLEEGKITKLGKVKKNNYKGDSYKGN